MIQLAVVILHLHPLMLCQNLMKTLMLILILMIYELMFSVLVEQVDSILIKHLQQYESLIYQLEL